MILTYVTLAIALLALVLLIWHVVTPTPPAHVRASVRESLAAEELLGD